MEPANRPNATINLNELRETYAQYVLVMFHDFRELADLLPTGVTSWWDAYLLKRDILLQNSHTKQMLDNFQNYYESFCRSRENIASDEPDVDNKDPTANNAPKPDEVEEDDDTMINLAEIDTLLGKSKNMDYGLEDGEQLDPFVMKLKEFVDPLLSVNPQTKTAVSITSADAAIAASQLPASRKDENTFILPGRAFVETTSRSAYDNNQSSQFPSFMNITRVDLLEKIEQSLSSAKEPWQEINCDGERCLDATFPTLQEHSKQWSLNEKQRLAFLLAGAALLKHIYMTVQSSQPTAPVPTKRLNASIIGWLEKILPVSGQLVMYLGGSGGTGKSRVIQAYVDFARRWHATASSIVCASTGVAAVLVEGCTLHFALAINVNLKPAEPKPKHIMAWSEVGVAFIDEFSMITPSLFDLLDSRLRKLKNRFDVPFGGLHIIFSGDFYQLPPVGPKIYSNAAHVGTSKSAKARKPSNSLALIRARDLWASCLSDAMILDENLRQQQDEDWANALERWRINQPTAKDIADINARIISRETIATRSISHPPHGTVAAVPENKAREQALRLCVKEMLMQLPFIETGHTDWRIRGVILLQARLSKTSSIEQIPLKQQKYIRKLPSKRLGAVGNLFCIIGAPYMVGTNSDVAKGVANGTLSVLQDVVLRPSCEIRIVNIDQNIQVHAVYADEVQCSIFKHSQAGWSLRPIYDTLPAGCFPVIPRQHSIICKMGNHANQRFRVQVTQLPCDLAMCLTGHKFQGQTTNSILLGSLGKSYRYGADGWLYVILSRVSHLSGVFTMERLNPDPTKYKLRLDVAVEMERLRRIETSTCERIKEAMLLAPE